MPTPATAIVDNVTVRIPTAAGVVHAATGVSLTLPPGQITALVGESGCGKSILASVLCGLLPTAARCTGTLTIAGHDMSTATERHWRRLRGRTVGLAAQSAAASFTPNRTIGRQLAETIAAVDAATDPAVLLEQVGLDPHTQHLYPHELSGGMAQRVAVAAAITADPPLLVADEPTAGLDPDATSTILGLLRSHADRGAAVLLITHDLHALETTGVADQIAVMYASRIVETGRAAAVFASPQHEYTRALLAALPARGLHPIPGMPPELTDLNPTYTFADRLAATTKATR
ncbi:ABC transporter ATP-binding protein [Rhodococcus sp. (in: high G+C Gram-positive bacteria)]|uniref:ABC transporter ATP-binding protein n=1 Tax=Rhodococcus sp. TaxID=1831 RepID=UPI003B8A89F6